MTKQTEKIAAQSKKAGGPSEPIVLTMANRLFGQQGYAFRPAYLKLLTDNFDAPLEPLDFTKDPAGAANYINGWVAKQTRERIRNLIPPNALNKDTRLVLANAIYLKAPWAEEFKQTQPTRRPFTCLAGRAPMSR